MDCRDRSHEWFEDFRESDMTVAKRGHSEGWECSCPPGSNEDDCDCASKVERIPVRYEVCGTCEGKGKHVNPNIDRNGLTAEDFDEDPDFRENYFSGMYDVPCNECHGNRVSLVVDEARATEAQVNWVTEWYVEEANDRRTRFYESGGHY
jgi:hypothetical protein